MPTPKGAAESIKSHHCIATTHGYRAFTSPQSVAQIYLDHGEGRQSPNNRETSLEGARTGWPDIVYLVMETSIIVDEASLQKENCLTRSNDPVEIRKVVLYRGTASDYSKTTVHEKQQLNRGALSDWRRMKRRGN